MKKGENRHGNPCRYGVYIYQGKIPKTPWQTINVVLQ
jgi:hypothetical protein